MLTTLAQATRARGGGKAAPLAVLLRAGLPIPDGFVILPAVDHAPGSARAGLRDAVARQLVLMGDPVVAVRSSATAEDTAETSAAGQYVSVIGVRGAAEVSAAIAACRASAGAARVADYRRRTGTDDDTVASAMSVLVQPMIEADVAGVMFTPDRPGADTRIEASWGLGAAVVDGTVTPDSYAVTPAGEVHAAVGDKGVRVDLDHVRGGVRTRAVQPKRRRVRTLDDGAATALAGLGGRVAAILDGPQDIEWAVAGGELWILQARPTTADLPARSHTGRIGPAGTLTGTPGAHGTVTAPARIVRGPSDFGAVRRGDIVVCRYTDPAWTPLFTIAGGVVTETGGALSHAAIVAREYRIPAVLGVEAATTRIADGASITVSGTDGTVTAR